MFIFRSGISQRRKQATITSKEFTRNPNIFLVKLLKKLRAGDLIRPKRHTTTQLGLDHSPDSSSNQPPQQQPVLIFRVHPFIEFLLDQRLPNAQTLAHGRRPTFSQALDAQLLEKGHRQISIGQIFINKHTNRTENIPEKPNSVQKTSLAGSKLGKKIGKRKPGTGPQPGSHVFLIKRTNKIILSAHHQHGLHLKTF